MDLATPLLPTILLDPLTLIRIDPVAEQNETRELGQDRLVMPDVDPASIPLPPSPPSSQKPSPPPIPIPYLRSAVGQDFSISPSPATLSLLDKVQSLESELAHAGAEIAERDVALEELRGLVNGLRGELSVVRGADMLVPVLQPPLPLARVSQTWSTARSTGNAHAGDGLVGELGAGSEGPVWGREKNWEEEDVNGGI